MRLFNKFTHSFHVDNVKASGLLKVRHAVDTGGQLTMKHYEKFYFELLNYL